MFKKLQLKNGMHVLLIESRKSPVVSVQMWVRTGSADESSGLEGISHFIEHLVFKGSSKYKVGEIASVVEGAGGELNAYTSFDQTVFYVTISKHFLETGFDVISQMMGFPTFDAQEIDNEREVVIEEIKRGHDSLHRQSSRLLFETVYQKHPYSIPVIGYEDNIRTVKREDVLKYYHSRYVPKAMTLIVTGDFDRQAVTAQIKKHFESFPTGKLAPSKRKSESPQKSFRCKVKKSTFEETLLQISWPTPKADHKDIAALEILSLVLGMGESSRLNQALRIRDNLVNYAGASTFVAKDPGFLSVSASLKIENLEATLKGLGEEIARIVSAPPTEAEVFKAKVNIQSEDFYAMETVDGMARQFGTYEDLFGDFRYREVFFDQVNEVKPVDILKVAKKYLRPDKMSVTLMTPGSEAESQKIIQNWKKKFDAQLRNLKPSKEKTTEKAKSFTLVRWPKVSPRLKVIANELKRITLPNGTVLLLRPSFDTPVISLRAGLLGGVRSESPELGGLTDLLGRVWTAGTKSLSEEQFHQKVDALASSIGGFAGRNTLGVNMVTLGAFADEIFPLFAEAFLEPSLSESVIEREKALMLESLRTRKDNPAQMAILNFMGLMFAGHPYSLDPSGTAESIPKLNRSYLLAHLQKLQKAKNLVVSISGHFDPEKWTEWITSLSQKLQTGERYSDRFSFKGNNSKHYESSQKNQEHIVIGFRGLTFTDPERYTLQVIQSILAGQGGRLFYELRDKASLAYSVSPLRMEGIDSGYFGAYIGCSPEKSEKSLSMLNQEFSRLAHDQVSDLELERAKKYLIGRHDIDLQKNSAVSAATLFDEIYGVPYDETFKYPEKIAAIDSRRVRDLAERLFSEPPVVSAVGPVCPWSA